MNSHVGAFQNSGTLTADDLRRLLQKGNLSSRQCANNRVNNSSRDEEHQTSRFLSESEPRAKVSLSVKVTVETELCKNTLLESESQQHAVQPNPEVNHVPADCLKCSLAGYDVNHAHILAQVYDRM